MHSGVELGVSVPPATLSEEGSTSHYDPSSNYILPVSCGLMQTGAKGTAIRWSLQKPKTGPLQA